MYLPSFYIPFYYVEKNAEIRLKQTNKESIYGSGFLSHDNLRSHIFLAFILKGFGLLVRPCLPLLLVRGTLWQGE